MIYADTDFFLALLKPDDWLKEAAMRLCKQHRGELSTREMARVLGVAEGTVKSRLHAARGMLRDTLDRTLKPEA